MTIQVAYIGETRNYVKYETPGLDFSIPGVKVKMWIPKEEIQTNIPGVYPEVINMRIIDNSESYDASV